MALATLSLTADLAEDGAYATDLSSRIHRWGGLSIRNYGRTADLDAAQMAETTLVLQNTDGVLSPKGGGLSGWGPYKRLKLTATWNATTYDQFQGIIVAIDVRPSADDQFVYVTCRDFLYILMRKEVSLPLTEGALSGILVSRILDLCEEDERVANERFKLDTAGWANLGAGVLSRVTAGAIFHRPASGEVVVSAAGDGAAYSLTGSFAVGEKVVGRAYIRAATAADEGKQIRVNIRDSLGVTNGTALALTNDYQPAEATRTLASATGVKLEIEAVTAAGFTFRIGAAHAVKEKDAFLRALDLGVARLERVFYNRAQALQAVQEIRANELGALFYFDRAGKAIYEERDHRWEGTHHTASQVAIDETFASLNYSEIADDRIKEVILDFPRWSLGEPGTQVFSLDRVPISIGAGASIIIETDFEGGLVRDVLKPVANTDYKLNSVPDGTGSDDSASVSLDFDDFGGGAKAKLTNNLGRMTFLTEYRLRGTPVRVASDRSPVRVSVSGGPALAAPFSHGFQLMTSEAHVQSFADYLANRYKTQRERLTITLEEPWPDAPTTGLMGSILGRSLGERITLTNDNYAWSSKLTGVPYYLDGIDVDVTVTGIRASWRLAPVDAAMFILDSSVLDGPDVLAV